MNYDITFCSNTKCKNLECRRNMKNLRVSEEEVRFISVSQFEVCEYWKEVQDE